MKNKFEQDLYRVKGAIDAASEHYNIYYIYTNARDNPKYINVMRCYLGFFRTSISAQFTAMLMTLSKVLDKNTRNNRISMFSLFKSAQEHQFIELSRLQQIKNKLNGIDEKVKKLIILRNNHFAHLGNLDPQKSFEHAGISLNDLKELIDLSGNILQEIASAYDRNSFADFPSKYSKKVTYSLLDDLLKMNN